MAVEFAVTGLTVDNANVILDRASSPAAARMALTSRMAATCNIRDSSLGGNVGAMALTRKQAPACSLLDSGGAMRPASMRAGLGDAVGGNVNYSSWRI
ncbi:MAG: hypothetical protein IPH87_21165 [Anaerolineae bacterium]|nr:hypothetical protein [Anaerolineae bacterium]